MRPRTPARGRAGCASPGRCPSETRSSGWRRRPPLCRNRGRRSRDRADTGCHPGAPVPSRTRSRVRRPPAERAATDVRAWSRLPRTARRQHAVAQRCPIDRAAALLRGGRELRGPAGQLLHAVQQRRVRHFDRHRDDRVGAAALARLARAGRRPGSTAIARPAGPRRRSCGESAPRPSGRPAHRCRGIGVRTRLLHPTARWEPPPQGTSRAVGRRRRVLESPRSTPPVAAGPSRPSRCAAICDDGTPQA